MIHESNKLVSNCKIAVSLLILYIGEKAVETKHSVQNILYEDGSIDLYIVTHAYAESRCKREEMS
jgi:hypothetical protein